MRWPHLEIKSVLWCILHVLLIYILQDNASIEATYGSQTEPESYRF